MALPIVPGTSRPHPLRRSLGRIADELPQVGRCESCKKPDQLLTEVALAGAEPFMVCGRCIL